MPATIQNDIATLRNIKGSSIPAQWRKKCGIQSNHVLTVVFKIEQKKSDTFSKNIFIPEEMDEWEKTLPIMELTDEESASVEESIKSGNSGISLEEFLNR
jgi:hypothetical protein